jgi:hypothetical protein
MKENTWKNGSKRQVELRPTKKKQTKKKTNLFALGYSDGCDSQRLVCYAPIHAQWCYRSQTKSNWYRYAATPSSHSFSSALDRTLTPCCFFFLIIRRSRSQRSIENTKTRVYTHSRRSRRRRLCLRWLYAFPGISIRSIWIIGLLLYTQSWSICRTQVFDINPPKKKKLRKRNRGYK